MADHPTGGPGLGLTRSQQRDRVRGPNEESREAGGWEGGGDLRTTVLSGVVLVPRETVET